MREPHWAVEIEAAPAEIWPVLTDFGAFPMGTRTSRDPARRSNVDPNTHHAAQGESHAT